MNLLVTAIHYQDVDRDEADDKLTPRPCAKLSDGWYHIRAELDECLARAVRRGRIKVGRKLAVIGAKVSYPEDGAQTLTCSSTPPVKGVRPWMASTSLA